MIASWYYAHDEKKLGPFSQTQLKELAAAGTILPIDTVWLEGNDNGVMASRVKHLFPPAMVEALRAERTLAAARPVVESPSPPASDVPQSTPAATPPAEAVVPPAVKPAPKERPKKKGRASALSGADIVGQDGEYARYRKKCNKCSHKDSSCHMIPITNKLFKSNFFCPKCRKRSEVAIQCHA